MDSILAPSVDGSYQTIFGQNRNGLFLQSLEEHRFLFRHTASGHSLFYFIGDEVQARKLQEKMSEAYDFSQDSTWVLKGQTKIHQVLLELNLERQWKYRAWHYCFDSIPC